MWSRENHIKAKWKMLCVLWQSGSAVWRQKKNPAIYTYLITRTVNKTPEHELEEPHCKEHITLINQDDFSKEMYAEYEGSKKCTLRVEAFSGRKYFHAVPPE